MCLWYETVGVYEVSDAAYRVGSFRECRRCGAVTNDFSDRHAAYCRNCEEASYSEERWEDAPVPERLRLDVRSILSAQQNGKCAICGKRRKLVLDHNHSTGLVRAMLCYSCNTGIGKFDDNPELLLAALHYLTRHKQHPGTFLFVQASRGAEYTRPSKRR